jgi:hypothetical protein
VRVYELVLEEVQVGSMLYSLDEGGMMGRSCLEDHRDKGVVVVGIAAWDRHVMDVHAVVSWEMSC